MQMEIFSLATLKSEAERSIECCLASFYWKHYTDGRGRTLQRPSLCLTIFTEQKDKNCIQTHAGNFLLGTKRSLHVTCLHFLEALQKCYSYIRHSNVYGCKNRPTCPPLDRSQLPTLTFDWLLGSITDRGDSDVFFS